MHLGDDPDPLVVQLPAIHSSHSARIALQQRGHDIVDEPLEAVAGDAQDVVGDAEDWCVPLSAPAYNDANRSHMTAAPVRALETELGGSAPDGLDTLTDEELSDLANRLHDAKRRQSRALDAAVEQALEIVPPLVRGRVRKALFR